MSRNLELRAEARHVRLIERWSASETVVDDDDLVVERLEPALIRPREERNVRRPRVACCRRRRSPTARPVPRRSARATHAQRHRVAPDSFAARTGADAAGRRRGGDAPCDGVPVDPFDRLGYAETPAGLLDDLRRRPHRRSRRPMTTPPARHARVHLIEQGPSEAPNVRPSRTSARCLDWRVAHPCSGRPWRKRTRSSRRSKRANPSRTWLSSAANRVSSR